MSVKTIKYLQKLISSTLVLFTFSFSLAQELRVIDNKGSLVVVNNTRVTSDATPPSDPLENDIWIDTTSNTVKVWDDDIVIPAWQEISSIRNWVSLTNNGDYAINHLVSYNGAIYKNITGTNTDTTPGVDLLNWAVIAGAQLSDADGDTKIQLEKTPDDDIIRFDLAGTQQFVMDGPRLRVLNSGGSIFIGSEAGANDNLTTNENVYIGNLAGQAGVNASSNTAIGHSSLRDNVSAVANTALGLDALLKTTNDGNTAIGFKTLRENVSGNTNSAFGNSTLRENISGSINVGVGARAFYNMTTGDNNIGIGVDTGKDITSSNSNTLIGGNTGGGIVTGEKNTIVGANVAGLNAALSNNIILADGDGLIQLQNDGTRWKSEDELQAGSFDTAWQNNTNGGVYAVNHIAIYNGVFYKNITGTNTDTTPDLDATNWVTSKDGLVSGSGTINYLSKFTAAGVVGNSQVYDNGTNIGIGTITPKVTLDIEGDAASTTVLDGMIPPRLTGDQLRAKTYSTDQTGAMVYITAADSAPTGQTANVDTVGYFYFNGTVWNPMSLNVNTTVCEIFDQVGGQLIDEGIFSDIELATTGIIDTSDYSVTSNSILIKSIGRYEITYRASVFGTLTNNQRTGAEFYLQIGGVESLGTRAYAYSRNSGEAPNIVGHNTVTVSKIIDVTVANTEVKIRGQIYASQTAAIVDLAMVPNGSSLIIKSIN